MEQLENWKFHMPFDIFILTYLRMTKCCLEWTLPWSLSREGRWTLTLQEQTDLLDLLYLIPCRCTGDSPGLSCGNLSRGEQSREFPCYLHGTALWRERLIALSYPHSLESYNNMPLTPSNTGNRSTNTSPKVDLIRVSCKWASRLAGQISTFFLLFTRCPPLTLFPDSQGGGSPQLK